MARLRLPLLVTALISRHVGASGWAKCGRAQREQGVTGYDLLDACDTFYGRDQPEFDQMIKFLHDLAGEQQQSSSVAMEVWRQLDLPEQHFGYFDKDGNGVLEGGEAYSWFMQRKGARDMDLSEVRSPPKGHKQPLGSWRDPLPSEHLVYRKPYPHPRDFWKKHMDGYLPAVLKGAQEGWPAMQWDRETLRKRFGWVDAKIEPKREGRGNNTAYADITRLAPRHRLNISDYLDREQGANIYIVSIIAQDMAWEVAHPSPLLCGSRNVQVDKSAPPPYKMKAHDSPHEAGHPWMTHIMEANLWISSGGTVSQFHYDKEWNVHCSVRGTKRWFFINPFDADGKLQWARGRKFIAEDPLNNQWTDWVYLEADTVDLIVQNKLRDLDYYELVQEPGDCIFIPYAMLHQVTSVDKGLQIAASWMFLPETVYDERACSEAPLEEDLPLATLDTLYAYTGKGIIPQGYQDPRNLVQQLQHRMKARGEKYLTLDIFTEAVSQGHSDLAQGKGRRKRIKKLFKLISDRAKDPANGLRWKELETRVPSRIWCKAAAESDSEGLLPCDDGQEFHLLSDDEFDKIERHISDSLSRQGKGEPAGETPRVAPPRIWSRTQRKTAGRSAGEL